ncbi:glycosyltransferase, partial [Candidatus Uhrbacteria bacterium]|nr:glycosyltransferase [Candidatus Uhrbacteria bacterium]
MQILHVSCVAPPKGGGIGHVADQEVRCLRKHGIEAWLACPKLTGRANMEHIIGLPAFGFGNGSWLRGLSKCVKEADVVHVHYPYYGTAEHIARLRKKGRIKRLAMTLHMDATANGIRGAFFKLHRKYIQPHTLSAADHVFVSSLDYAQNSSFANFLLANKAKITELPFGVDTNCYSQGSPNRSRFNMPAGCLVVGTVSVQDKAHQFKGIDLLIKAMVDLPGNVHLLLVGDGNMRAQYKA